MQNCLKEIKQNKTEIDIIGWNGHTVAILHDVNACLQTGKETKQLYFGHMLLYLWHIVFTYLTKLPTFA